MERYSNRAGDYWNQIKKELLGSSEGEEFSFRYLEMGQLYSHGFSVTRFRNKPEQLVLKIWNAKYDNDRFKLGVYNLERLAIDTQYLDLHSEEVNKLDEFLGGQFELVNWDGAVLDGLFCQLEVDSKVLEWNCNEEINRDTLKLVEYLRNKSDK